MPRLTLLFNPAAGGAAQARGDVDRAARIFSDHGIKCEVVETVSPEDATRQARAARDQGVDAVFACGGDGTMHYVLQALAGQTQTALGVLPLGSANVLARHLGLPMSATGAAKAQTTLESQCLPAGRVAFATSEGERERFFLTVAGAGPDGALVYRMLGENKQWLGRLSYYARAAKLFAFHRFPAFEVDAVDAAGQAINGRAVSAMTVRVADMGGIFTPLACGTLESATLTLTLVKPPASFGLPAWFALSWARMHRLNFLAGTHEVASFRCSPVGAETVQVQADGEHLGRAPMEVTLVANAVRLIVPGKLHR